MTANYSKPTMVRVGNPLYAKHGSASQSYPFVRTEIEGVSVTELTEKYGSPLYVFSERILRARYQEAYQAFASVYPQVKFGWSYKTNYLNAICNLFHQEGALAEVVSNFEYQKARALGVPGSQIIFNGPYKQMAALRVAAQEGAIINADHFAELEDLESVANELQRELKIGIRINLDAGVYPTWSRFGFNLENGQALAAVRRILQSPRLRLAGLHCHIGTFVLDSTAYGRAASKLSEFMRSVESLAGYPLDYLDLGGGIPSRNHLRGVYQPPEIAVPPVATYAKIIGQELKWLLSRPQIPTLYLENGRHLVDEAGWLITSVVADKLLSDGRRSYVLDAGVNLLYAANWYKFKIELDRPTSGVREPCLLNGPLCMNIDVVDEAISLPRLTRFQKMIISPVGAYNITNSMQFIQYRPAVVMVDSHGQVHPICRAETLEDLTGRELPWDNSPAQAA